MILKEVIKILEDLTNKNFYGEILIKMESGKIVIIKKTESIK